MNKNQVTVDELLGLLNSISKSGHGDMNIFMGERYPLLSDAVCINLMSNELHIKNTYYDEKMEEAMRNARNNLKRVCRKYIADCYDAGIMKGYEQK